MTDDQQKSNDEQPEPYKSMGMGDFDILMDIGFQEKYMKQMLQPMGKPKPSVRAGPVSESLGASYDVNSLPAAYYPPDSATKTLRRAELVVPENRPYLIRKSELDGKCFERKFLLYKLF